MADQRSDPIGARIVEQRLTTKGIRPRVAASIIATLWVIAIVIFGIVQHLIDPDTFTTIWDGMWWGTQTVTTVGYGDIVPEDTVGQVIAAIMMIGGLSLFAVITGSITSAFVARAEAARHEEGEDRTVLKLEEIGAQLTELREQLGALEARLPPSASGPPAER
jgi:voltage-gated potassium channel Kch